MTPWNRSARYGAVAAILGLVVFTSAPATAWADPTGSDSHDTSSSTSASSAGSDKASDSPASPPSGASTKPDAGAEKDKADASPTKTSDEGTEAEAAAKTDVEAVVDPKPTTEPSADPEPETAPTSSVSEPEPRAPKSSASEPSVAPSKADAKKAAEPDAVVIAKASSTPTVTSPSKAKEPSTSEEPSAARVAAATAAPVATLSAAAVETTAVTPGPVSPIAQIAALPGRIVNAVLQVLGITTSAGTGQSPFSPAPIADLFFAVFRKLEEMAGLDTPVLQPVPPALVYEGPVDVPTPTVKQFLDASTAEYGLGTTPGGMVPFTVNGWPMTSLHLATGSDASVWVTPQNQIIIAYSGTTGGTNLFFNRLIAVTQILTDLQAGLGTSTPLAFDQAVDFAEAVKAEATAQGYSPDDIFVTGHSLGAWQAQYVAQQIGLNGIGFEGPGLNSVVPGNGANSLFVNTATYGDMAGFLASDLPGLSPLAPPYVPGGGAKPHYGPIVLLGDPSANTPMVNAAGLWGKGIIGTLVSAIDLFGNFFAKHLPGVQAYHLDVQQDPGVVPWLGIREGPVYTGFGDLTIGEFLKAASDKGILVTP